MRALKLILLAAGLQACASPGGQGADVPTDLPEDASWSDLDTRFNPSDHRTPDDTGAIPDTRGADFAPPCDPGSGCFLDPCTGDSDCLSGHCVDHMGDKVCTIDCIEECPGGWACELLGGGPDPVYVCLSPFTHLCRPCSSSLDCRSPSGVEDVCVEYGPDGDFCGASCSEDGDCPEGYLCQGVTTTEMAVLKQCVPAEGECPCSDTAVALGLGTGCEVSNAEGTCKGVRICEEEGLSPCDAAAPAAEECNGVDDDCDGLTDEGTCDDGNPCSTDTCAPTEGGCAHEVLTGIACDDEDVCTIADHCDDGVCTGTFVDCDDGNICTDDVCLPSGGCLYELNEAVCDDSDPCTVQDHCAGGLCGGTPVSCDCLEDGDCDALEDGNLCNGTLRCDVEVVPMKCVLDLDTIIACPPPEGPGAQCLEAACDPPTGFCDIVPVEDGSLCDDGSVCTQLDTCAAGECTGAVPLYCDEGNPCTDDVCDPALGCLHLPNLAACSDGDACTVGDACGGGLCLGGEVLDCADATPCTDDWCDGLLGCVHLPNQAPCDDLNACSFVDGCVAGLCVGVGVPDCDDQNPCTHDWCDPGPGCQHVFHNLPCDDGNACTVGEACLEGACTGGASLNCNDGNPCTNDGCSSLVGCQQAFNSLPCNDGNACTTGDACAQGVCSGLQFLNCNDGNPCTADSCVATTGCVHAAVADSCNDNNPCTTGDHCQGGMCTPSGSMDCDDQNPCTDDFCSPYSGCVHVPNNAPCSDGKPCTTGDTCLNGICTGLIAVSCDDGNPCTTDSCNLQTGCVNAYNMDPCDDQNDCTTGDVCVLGVCKGTGTLACDDSNICTYDLCLPTGGCDHQPVSGPCNDGDGCTQDDTCGAGVCTAGPPRACDDLNPCTLDGCAGGACTHDPLSGTPCSDGNLCTVSDACKAGTCTGSPKTCNDGNACTVDYCDPATGCVGLSGVVVCNDGNPCTDDTCNPLTGCTYTPNTKLCNDQNACTLGDACQGGTCTPASWVQCNDNNPCTDDACSPASGGCVFSNNSLPCSDGSLCTLQDYCSGGQCVPGQVLPCGDGNDCTSDTCHPVFGCKYVNVSGACNDGNPCTGPDLCTAGACQGTGLTNCADTISCTLDSCNPFLGCVHVSLDALCADDIPCTLNACGPLGCTLSLDHDACDDEVPCTQDTCDAVLGCLHVPTVDYLTDEDNCGGCGIHCQPGQTCTGGKCV